MTEQFVPDELLEDLSPLGAPMLDHIEGLRLEVGHRNSSFKNERRSMDLLLAILEPLEILEPGDLDCPVARRLLIDTLATEAEKKLDGGLSAGTHEHLERRVGEFRRLLRIAGVSEKTLASLKRMMPEVNRASGLRVKAPDDLDLEELMGIFGVIEEALSTEEVRGGSNRQRVLEGTLEWSHSTSRPTLLRVRLGALLHSTGRRRSEILGLRRSDISTEEIIFPIVKGNDFPIEFRVIPASWLAEYIEAALEVMPDDPDEPLVREDTYQRLTRAVWVEAGLPGRTRLHAFRNISTDLILDAGLGLEVVRDWLTHRDLNTTLGYLSARRVVQNRVEASNPVFEALGAMLGRGEAQDAPIALPAMTREVDGSLTLEESVRIGDLEFDRLYPALSSGPTETEAGIVSLTIYSPHRLSTKTNSSGYTEPLDLEFAFSNPTVTMLEDDDGAKILSTSGSMLDEWWAIQDSNPCPASSNRLLRLISESSKRALRDLERGDEGSAHALLNLLARMGVRP